MTSSGDLGPGVGSLVVATLGFGPVLCAVRGRLVALRVELLRGRTVTVALDVALFAASLG